MKGKRSKRRRNDLRLEGKERSERQRKKAKKGG